MGQNIKPESSSFGPACVDVLALLAELSQVKKERDEARVLIEKMAVVLKHVDDSEDCSESPQGRACDKCAIEDKCWAHEAHNILKAYQQWKGD